MQYARLLSSTPEKNANVTLYHHNGGDVSGNIVDVIGDFIQYTIGPEIRLGSPLLNEDRDVVGIHVGLWDSSNESAQTTCKGIKIQSILVGFTKHILKSLGDKTENELWLDKINQIPKAEYEFIGSGGYAKVYKITIQAELAIKIVRGVGTLNECATQVRALEKEYGVVTSLDNHPRIIKFFGFVTDVTEVQLMIIMEYLEGGSLANKLKDKKPLPNNSVYKYFVQILEGVDFLHQRNIYHSDINPANILLTSDDNIKICDFGIAVGLEWQTDSSATSSHVKGDYHYMSPERLNNASRSAANDIWSIGATFVQMISDQQINHQETFPQIVLNILQYKIFINGMPYSEFLKTLSDFNLKKKIISRTICIESCRANCQQLLSILPTKKFSLVRRIPKQTLIRAGENYINISGMSYKSALDELFLADYANDVVRAIRLRDNTGDLRDVYSAPHDTTLFVYSVCHMRDSDTLLVCSGEKGPDQKYAKWLVVLSRNGIEWREAQRVQTDGIGRCCQLSDSRLLIAEWFSTYMELFRVVSGPRIARVHRIHVPEKYYWFSAKGGSNTLVAMSYGDHSVRVHRLCCDRLEELARIQFKSPGRLLWLADRLLVAVWDRDMQSHAVIDLEMSSTRLESGRKLIATSENVQVSMWCAVDDALAIVDSKSKDILHYSFV